MFYHYITIRKIQIKRMVKVAHEHLWLHLRKRGGSSILDTTFEQMLHACCLMRAVLSPSFTVLSTHMLAAMCCQHRVPHHVLSWALRVFRYVPLYACPS